MADGEWVDDSEDFVDVDAGWRRYGDPEQIQTSNCFRLLAFLTSIAFAFVDGHASTCPNYSIPVRGRHPTKSRRS